MAEYEPMVHIIMVSVTSTTGFVPGSIGATCARPVIDPEPDA